MSSIQRLGDDCRDRYIRPAFRLIEAQKKIEGFFIANPSQRDMDPQYEAIAAWMVVTCCYSGIEQSMKCLLQINGSFRKDDHFHHNIGKLFQDLTSHEKQVLRMYYSVYRSLHTYIPPESVDCFLSTIDRGYQKWRYFLLEGKKPPITHPGAMVEIWLALCDVLKARVFTNHGMQSVDRRIFDRLQRMVFLESWGEHATTGSSDAEVAQFVHWIKCHGGLTAAFAGFFNRRATNTVDTLDLMPFTLRLLQTAAGLAEKDKSDLEFCFFLKSAAAGNLPSEFLDKLTEPRITIRISEQGRVYTI